MKLFLPFFVYVVQSARVTKRTVVFEPVASFNQADGKWSTMPPHDETLKPFTNLLLTLHPMLRSRISNSIARSFTGVSPKSLMSEDNVGNSRTQATSSIGDPVHLVWFTGADDLRVHDHGGLSAAASSARNGSVVPIFVLDPDVHLKYAPSRLTLLHTALLSLQKELRERYNVPLLFRRGSTAAVLLDIAHESGATTCHIIADDVEQTSREAQRAGSSALQSIGVNVQRWDGTLRPAAWDSNAQQLPGNFPAYLEAISSLPLAAAQEAPNELPFRIEPLASDSITPIHELLADAAEIAPQNAASTLQPFDDLASSMGEERAARDSLKMYVLEGRDKFADARFTQAARSSSTSLHAIAAQRLLDGAEKASKGFALREAPSRAFAPALAVGSLSAREVRSAASDAGAGAMAVAEDPWWGRSSAGALADTVEWREWFKLLARRSLALQEANQPFTSGGERVQGGDSRVQGQVGYWRWGGQYLVRYMRWEAGPSYRGDTPPILFLHGFAASGEQWERLVHELRAQASTDMSTTEAALPPMYAMDLLGFGHAEKPGLSYTQYLWEAQIVDFVVEVMQGTDVVLCGNSIGGGLSAGAAESLGPLCQGVVLCNTAGVLLEREEYNKAREDSVKKATLEGRVGAYSPVPILGQPALDLFGKAIVKAIYPQIETRLATYYEDRPANADPALIYAIQQGASSPGSANVVGSGQKLAPNRPLNEVLGEQGFAGPVLVAQGLNDRVSGPARAIERADTFSTMREGITVERIQGGHCVQDDSPDAVARAVLKWLPEVRSWSKKNRAS